MVWFDVVNVEWYHPLCLAISDSDFIELTEQSGTVMLECQLNISMIFYWNCFSSTIWPNGCKNNAFSKLRRIKIFDIGPGLILGAPNSSWYAKCALQVTASGDTSLAMWDMVTYKSTAVMYFHTCSVKSVDISAASPSEWGGEFVLCGGPCPWHLC